MTAHSRPTIDIRPYLDNGYLHLILFATEQCNFRCNYCYEDFTTGKMQAEVVEGVKNLIKRRAAVGLQHLELSWFGGEPLLNMPLLLDISTYAQQLSRERGCAFYGSVTTNGYALTNANFTQLVKCGIENFQISLDGPNYVHDSTRHLAKGGATFARIWSNLLAVQDTDLPAKVLIRLHISHSNLAAMADLVKEINEAFAEDRRFCVTFKPIEKLGGPNDAELAVLSSKEKDSAIRWLASLLRYPEQEVRGAAAVEPYVCYAARPNSLAIRADGTIAKCTVALRDPQNSVGQLARDGTITIDKAKFRYWSRGLASLKIAELECPWNP